MEGFDTSVVDILRRRYSSWRKWRSDFLEYEFWYSTRKQFLKKNTLSSGWKIVDYLNNTKAILINKSKQSASLRFSHSFACTEHSHDLLLAWDASGPYIDVWCIAESWIWRHRKAWLPIVCVNTECVWEGPKRHKTRSQRAVNNTYFQG